MMPARGEWARSEEPALDYSPRHGTVRGSDSSLDPLLPPSGRAGRAGWDAPCRVGLGDRKDGSISHGTAPWGR